VEDGLRHKFVELRDVVLPLKVEPQRALDIGLNGRALGDERVDLLALDLPGDAVDEQRVLDRVELTEHGVHLDVFSEKDLGVDVYELVQLLNGQDVEVLVDEE